MTSSADHIAQRKRLPRRSACVGGDGLVAALACDRRGSLTIKFALVLPILLMLTGGVIDYGFYVQHRSKLQSAADAASRAAALEFTLIDYTKHDVVSLAKALVENIMKANGDVSGPAGEIHVTATAETEPLRVTVDVLQDFFGYFRSFGLWAPAISVRSVAQVIGKPNICVLGLDTQASGTIELQTMARMTGQNCAIYSNSSSTTGIASRSRSMMTASMICSVGGGDGGRGNFSPEPITDCPVFEDPLASRAMPSVGGCTATNLELFNVTAVLEPGVYCGGISIRGRSEVTVKPGTYVIKDGALSVHEQASLVGEFAGFFLTGIDARLDFATGTTISLTAPKDGVMAGLLFHESRDQTSSYTHEIRSDNARTLLGTIYLPRGELIIDSNRPVADASAYTAIVARTIRLYSGPNLVLNTNYDETAIPVPEGIKGFRQPVALVQ